MEKLYKLVSDKSRGSALNFEHISIPLELRDSKDNVNL
jgi:hypothetical protein